MNIEQRLRAVIWRITSIPLRETCETLLTDEAFLKAPASVKHHHAYTGGLAVHTAEVADTAYHMTLHEFREPVNLDVLMTAALWHDYCKIHEYTEYPVRNRIGHITGSVLAFYQCTNGCGQSLLIPDRTYEAIAHAMLAHHGPVREWGSPVAPQTIEAMILHQADMLSANYGKAK